MEPTKIIAGDTVEWSKSLPDYPASSYTLKYYIKGDSISASVTATPDGDDFSISIVKATTAAWNTSDDSKEARLDGFIENAGGTERFHVYSGRLTVKPNPETVSASFEGRTQARQNLEAVETAIAALISGGAKTYSLSVAGNSRTVTKNDLTELFQQREFWKAEVTKEEQAEAIANGAGINPRNIGIRFNRI